MSFMNNKTWPEGLEKLTLSDCTDLTELPSFENTTIKELSFFLLFT